MKRQKRIRRKGIVRKFFSYYRPHKGLFALDLVCSFAIALCNLFYPFVTRNVIDTYVPDRLLEPMLIWLGVLAAIFVAKALLTYVVQYWGHLLGVKIQSDMRTEFFRHAERLPFSYFDETKTGTVMSRLVNDLFEVSELAHHGPEDTFTSFVTIVGAVVLMCLIDVPLAMIVFAFVPLMLAFALLSRKKMSAAFAESRREMAEINADVESSVSGIRVTKAYAAEATEERKFEKSNARYRTARGKAYRSMGIFYGGMGLFNDLLYLVVLLAGGLFFFYGRIDVGEFAAFILYVTMLLNPIRTLVNIFEQIQDGTTGFVRFREVMEIPEEDDPTDPVPVGTLRGEIKFENVSFSYKNPDREDTAVIRHFSLEIPKGKTVALVGPSGGGKTTLCHLIPRFYEVDEGRITIDGIDVRAMRRADLRRNVGIVSQDVFLFGGTIRENIAYGNPNADEAAILRAARAAGADEFVSELPDGYETEVGERGVKLSGGQKQRIAIARAFLKDPPVLILDEATSALDNVTERRIQKSLDELCAGRTTIVVAHRLTTVRDADEIVVITQEGVRERGTHDELIARGGIYAELNSVRFD